MKALLRDCCKLSPGHHEKRWTITCKQRGFMGFPTCLESWMEQYIKPNKVKLAQEENVVPLAELNLSRMLK